MVTDESGLGARIFHPGELLDQGRATKAPSLRACAVLDLGSRINWYYLLLTLLDSFIRADALVLVRFHAMAHTVDFTVDNYAVVDCLCVVLLSIM